MKTFLDQQQQFRQQMGSMLGQTPWSMMSQLTERNMAMWEEFQRNLGSPAKPADKPRDPAAGSKRKPL